MYNPDLTNEKWEIINDSDGNFMISNCGRVKQLEHTFTSSNGVVYRREECIKKLSFNSQNRYLYVTYRNKLGKTINKSVHRLVALHFVYNPNPNEYNEVNHINATLTKYGKTNNCDWNLEWTNNKLNMEHASKNGLINKDSIKRKKQASLNAKNGSWKNWTKIVEYDELGKLINIYDSGIYLKNKSGNNPALKTRLSYNNKFYRSYDIFMDKFGFIPKQINIDRINVLRNKKRRLFKQYKDGILVNTYEQLNDLPITRNEMWVCFNHETKDKYGCSWDVIIDDNYIYNNKQGIKITLTKDDEGLTFNSIPLCAKWINDTIRPNVKFDTICQYIQRKKSLYGYDIIKGGINE